jgi:hypothetical protein
MGIALFNLFEYKCRCDCLFHISTLKSQVTQHGPLRFNFKTMGRQIKEIPWKFHDMQVVNTEQRTYTSYNYKCASMPLKSHVSSKDRVITFAMVTAWLHVDKNYACVMKFILLTILITHDNYCWQYKLTWVLLNHGSLYTCSNMHAVRILYFSFFCERFHSNFVEKHRITFLW